MPKGGDVGEVVNGYTAEVGHVDELANGGIGGFRQAPKHRPSPSSSPEGASLGGALFGNGGAGKGASLQHHRSLSSAPPQPLFEGAPLGPRELALSKQVDFWSGEWLCGPRRAHACLLGCGAGGRESLRA